MLTKQALDPYHKDLYLVGSELRLTSVFADKRRVTHHRPPVGYDITYLLGQLIPEDWERSRSAINVRDLHQTIWNTTHKVKMTTSKAPLGLIVYRNSLKSGIYNSSPFVNKLEARLRLAGVPYRTVFGTRKQAPRGKVPYVGFDDKDELIADTTFIFRRLVNAGVLPDLNAGLTPAQKAQDLAIRALLEDKLYFFLVSLSSDDASEIIGPRYQLMFMCGQVRERWMDNFYTMRPNALVGMPWLLQVVIGNIAYRTVKNALYLQGTGRLLPEEVRCLKQEAWESLGAILSEARIRNQSQGSEIGEDDPFWVLGGDQPTEADSVVYGFIAGSLVCEA